MLLPRDPPHAGSYVAQVGLREQQRIVSLPATSLSLRGHTGQGQVLRCRDDWTDASCRLAKHPARGATPRVTAEQQAHIPAMLVKGASTYGLCREVWKSRRLAVAIKRECGVNCHPTQRMSG